MPGPDNQKFQKNILIYLSFSIIYRPALSPHQPCSHGKGNSTMVIIHLLLSIPMPSCDALLFTPNPLIAKPFVHYLAHQAQRIPERLPERAAHRAGFHQNLQAVFPAGRSQQVRLAGLPRVRREQRKCKHTHIIHPLRHNDPQNKRILLLTSFAVLCLFVSIFFLVCVRVLHTGRLH